MIRELAKHVRNTHIPWKIVRTLAAAIANAIINQEAGAREHNENNGGAR